MVSLNMTWCSFILTTALLFCVLVVVTEGRSVEKKRRLPDEEELDLDIKIDEDDGEEQARYMPSGMMGDIMKMIQSHMGEDTEQSNVSIIFLPIGGGGGGGLVDDGGDDIPSSAIAEAIVPEIVAAAAAAAAEEEAEDDAATADATRRRRRRRRRRPVNSGYRRVSQNRKRRPNGRRVFVIRSSDTTQ